MRTLLALLLICFSVNSNSQTWPSKPLRYIVPFPPGAFNDTLARTISAELTKTLRESLIQKGMKFNDVNATLFRDKLRAAGFYNEWKQKFGDQAWSTLEASVGKLS